jgi:hypothetical protein
MLLCYDIVRVLVYAANYAAAEGVEIPVKLEDVVWTWSYVFVGLVDRGQHIAVARNLLLVAIAGLYPFLHKGVETLICGVYTFDAVGRTGTLDLGNLKERSEDVRLCFDEELLPATAFVET